MPSSPLPFTRRSLLAGAALAAAPATPPAFRFLQINDLHFVGPLQADKGYLRANQRIDWLFDRIRAREFFPAFDFIVVLGDFVHGGTLETIREEVPIMQARLEALGVPYYTVIGNHENRQAEGDPTYEGPYRSAFGTGRTHYSFVHKGVEFVILNNSGSATNRPVEVYTERLNRLQTMLSANPALPKVLCCHIPLISVRDEPILKTSFGFSSYRTKEPEILEVVQGKRSNVRAVLSGHLHLTGSAMEGRVRHVSISGTASYPHDVALYSVYADRIESEVIRLPSDLLTPETNIHGTRRHKREFTDSLHPDYTGYLMGNPGERRWTIPLR